MISCDACGCGDNRQGHGDSVSLDSQIVPITLSKRDEALFPRRDTCLTCSAWWCSPNAAVRLVWCSEWGSDLWLVEANRSSPAYTYVHARLHWASAKDCLNVMLSRAGVPASFASCRNVTRVNASSGRCSSFSSCCPTWPAIVEMIHSSQVVMRSCCGF